MKCTDCRFHQNAPACEMGVCRPLDRALFNEFGCTLYQVGEPSQQKIEQWIYQLSNAKQHLFAKQLIAVYEVVTYLTGKVHRVSEAVESSLVFGLHEMTHEADNMAGPWTAIKERIITKRYVQKRG